MPRYTPWQIATDVLLDGIALQLHLDAQANSQQLISSLLEDWWVESDDNESNSDSSDSSSSSDSGSDINAEEVLGDSDDNFPNSSFSQVLISCLSDIHSHCYLQDCVAIPKSSETLWLTLNEYKRHRPDLFRCILRITPQTFDALLAAISDDPIFTNNSESAEQVAIQFQLAVTFYHLGHYGNSASLVEVGLWAGIGWGTVDLYTHCIITAICRDRFRRAAIQWPTPEEKEAASQWVEEVSCPAWHLM
jgi:hypothetical protein